MRGLREVARVAAVAVSVTTWSCGGSGGDVGSGGATSGEPGTQAAQATAERDLNACHLLGNEEVGALAGRTVVMRDQTEAGDSYSVCEYSDEAGTFVLGLTVYWAGGKDQWDIWRTATGLAGALTESNEGVGLDEVVEQGPVAGLGDAAFFSALLPSLVLEGDVLLEINMALIPEAGTKFRGLAEMLLGRF